MVCRANKNLIQRMRALHSRDVHSPALGFKALQGPIKHRDPCNKAHPNSCYANAFEPLRDTRGHRAQPSFGTASARELELPRQGSKKNATRRDDTCDQQIAKGSWPE